MLYLVVYLFDRYVEVVRTIGLVAVVSLFVIIALLCARFIYYDVNPKGDFYIERDRVTYKLASSIFSNAIRVFVVTFTIFILAPSKQGLAMLGGVYVGQQVYEGLNKSELVNKAVAVLDKELNSYLDEYLAPTQPNTDAQKH